jgi:hypothetical protein
MKKLFAIAFAALVGVAVLGPTKTADAQVVYSNYCCDGYGNHRCVMNNGPFPVGAACFCYGQGNGIVCP